LKKGGHVVLDSCGGDGEAKRYWLIDKFLVYCNWQQSSFSKINFLCVKTRGKFIVFWKTWL
jgi:hypothetical protein